jgi:hypothetical protein
MAITISNHIRRIKKIVINKRNARKTFIKWKRKKIKKPAISIKKTTIYPALVV